MEKKQLCKPPTLQGIKMETESDDGYREIYPEMLKVLNIWLVLPVRTASVKCCLSQMKLVKTKLRSRLNEACKDKAEEQIK